MSSTADLFPAFRRGDVTAIGRSLVGAADSAAVRTAVGVYSTDEVDTALALKANTADLGTAAFTDSTSYATFAQGALADSAVQPGDLATVATSGSYDDLTDKPTTPIEYLAVALSPNATAISSGTGKGFIPIDRAGTVVSFRVQCDPANEPSTIAVQVDLNDVDLTTGAATSLLSSVASIATGSHTATGTISGSPTVAAGDLLSCDVDQGSDGQDLIAIVGIQPS